MKQYKVGARLFLQLIDGLRNLRSQESVEVGTILEISCHEVEVCLRFIVTHCESEGRNYRVWIRAQESIDILPPLMAKLKVQVEQDRAKLSPSARGLLMTLMAIGFDPIK